MTNDYVTYETAKALKEAGYPQPDKKHMQSWYGVGSNKRGASEVKGLYIFDYAWPSLSPFDYVYIPTLTDLLNTLGPGATVRALGLGEFEVTDDPNRKPIVTNNPCEALGRLILENAKQLFRAVETP